MYGDVEYYPMEIDISSIGDLRSLTHLTIDHCTLGPGFSAVLAKLPLLVELDLSGSGCTEGIVVVGLSHLLVVSMRHSDIPELLISDCAALHTVAAGFSEPLVGVIIISCPSLAELTVEWCSSLAHLDVSGSLGLVTLEAASCKLADVATSSETSQRSHASSCLGVIR